MLALPLVAVLSGAGTFTGWTTLLAHSILSKVRYVSFTSRLYSERVPARYFLALPFITFVDFLVWVTPIIEASSPKARERW